LASLVFDTFLSVTLSHQADSPAHEEDGAGELFDGGQEFLDRMAIALGGKSLVPAAGEGQRGVRDCALFASTAAAAAEHQALLVYGTLRVRNWWS
jgi:hypothetical protein